MKTILNFLKKIIAYLKKLFLSVFKKDVHYINGPETLPPPLTKEEEELLKASFEAFKLSARARGRILKVARTIADMSLSEDILPEHLLEAISYRKFDINK